ncbi:hypothetical protein [Psychroserpens sp. NJDZ02]|uniref:hypothetical protein n=1 Tax=Psychroserpens sp. NJDZ02 TaxID=2570561 RepID=UPI0010A94B5E|nr:hypothetical protein [Psychroserpens sp. NJDZ02]QCE43319.1 hypothetical protein E9099_18475 [Psychroserpens sp. NJDZ02]
MSNRVEGFFKSELFCYRQWDRQVSDNLLSEILKGIEPNSCNTLLIVSRNVLKKTNKNINEELFIKVDNKTLITCFYCQFQEYLVTKRVQKYLIIDNI